MLYSHFKLYGCQPVIFCNVLDPADADMMKSAESKVCNVAGHRITLPFETIKETYMELQHSHNFLPDGRRRNAGTAQEEQ